jgi:hypothetical protein
MPASPSIQSTLLQWTIACCEMYVSGILYWALAKGVINDGEEILCSGRSELLSCVAISD